MDDRQIRGKEIAKTKKIKFDKERHIWLVPSQSIDKVYFVDEEMVCKCPDAELTKLHADIPCPCD